LKSGGWGKGGFSSLGMNVSVDTLSKLDSTRGQAPTRGAVPGLESESAEAMAATQLMSRVQQGDMEAFQELIRQFQRKVFRVISSYHRNPEDAMEVVQDTFFKVYSSRHTWERRSSFSGWLYRIAINASIDRHRRQGKHSAASLEDVVESAGHSSATLTSHQTPHDQLRSRERRRLLENAVRRLPERQREVVSLRYFGEMQLEEIARALGLPLGTVKSNLHKAVSSLKDVLLRQKEVLV